MCFASLGWGEGVAHLITANFSGRFRTSRESGGADPQLAASSGLIDRPCVLLQARWPVDRGSCGSQGPQKVQRAGQERPIRGTVHEAPGQGEDFCQEEDAHACLERDQAPAGPGIERCLHACCVCCAVPSKSFRNILLSELCRSQEHSFYGYRCSTMTLSVPRCPASSLAMHACLYDDWLIARMGVSQESPRLICCMVGLRKSAAQLPLVCYRNC